MKYTSTILALAAVTVAQTISDLPSCSLACVANGVTGVDCSITDFECACGKADQLTPSVTPCVQQACSDTADQAKVITVLEGICASAGVPITIPEPGASSSAAPASSAPASSAAAASSVAPTVETSAPVSTAATSAAGYPTASAEETCVESTITVTVTATASKPVPTAPGSSAAPYPTTPAPYPSAPAGTGSPVVPKPSGSGAPAQPSSPPQFTGAASAVKVPAGVAGVLGLVAYLL
ncbi:hypothetical protein BDV96DRAFT_112810 [Lophiotrema nucula]|uniref:CFEM domain-containing protein n=1 Tax=Lophiotrema nucula TaxID=690887 RepID=A0A6A5Z4B0_9PLEO|nr:hypothetical protein BDV96DRAFT_112810 [Lophiotrema nucula]